MIEMRSPLRCLSSKTACSYQSFASLVNVISEPCFGRSMVFVLFLTPQVLRCFFAALHFGRVEHRGAPRRHLRRLQLSQRRHSGQSLLTPKLRRSPISFLRGNPKLAERTAHPALSVGCLAAGSCVGSRQWSSACRILGRGSRGIPCWSLQLACRVA